LALKPHTAIYALSVSDFELADVNIALSKVGNVYTYTLDAKTKGLAAMIKDYQIRSKSVFGVSQFGLQSQRYQNFERDGDRVKKDIDIHPKKVQVDPLNQTLAISDALEKNANKKDFYLLLNDGKSVTKKYYRKTHEGNNLIKVVSEDGNTEVHFAKDRHYIPILIRNKNFSYELKKLRLK
jgi:hypothetical protein